MTIHKYEGFEIHKIERVERGHRSARMVTVYVIKGLEDYGWFELLRDAKDFIDRPERRAE